MITLARLSFAAALAALAAGCYAETYPAAYGVTSADVTIGGYSPAYYDGYVVYYDRIGRPYYYNGGVAYWIPPSSPYYGGYENHYRYYGGYYPYWYNHYGYRYGGYRAGPPGYYGYRGYHGYPGRHH